MKLINFNNDVLITFEIHALYRTYKELKLYLADLISKYANNPAGCTVPMRNLKFFNRKAGTTMFTLEEMLSKRNQALAFQHFKQKKNSSGLDNMPLSELEDYWNLNQDRIKEELLTGTYQPGVIKIQEIITKNGKRRNISTLNTIDRFITRLLAQKLHRYIEPLFLKNSFAFQENKGIQDAVLQAKSYIDANALYVCEIDLKDFFDNIPHHLLMKQLKAFLSNSALLQLIEKYIYCQTSFNGKITAKTKGIIQGNSISPILSNLYLHPLDTYMESQNYQWIRFADNIYIYASSQTECSQIFNHISKLLEQKYVYYTSLRR